MQEASALKIVPTISSSSVQPIVINAEMMPVFAAEVLETYMCLFDVTFPNFLLFLVFP